MGKNDLLVFTNEIGANSKWDGTVRGGFTHYMGCLKKTICKNWMLPRN